MNQCLEWIYNGFSFIVSSRGGGAGAERRGKLFFQHAMTPILM